MSRECRGDTLLMTGFQAGTRTRQEMRPLGWSGARMQRQGKWEHPKKSRLRAVLPSRVPKCEDFRSEPGSSWWEASALATAPTLRTEMHRFEVSCSECRHHACSLYEYAVIAYCTDADIEEHVLFGSDSLFSRRSLVQSDNGVQCSAYKRVAVKSTIQMRSNCLSREFQPKNTREMTSLVKQLVGEEFANQRLVTSLPAGSSANRRYSAAHRRRGIINSRDSQEFPRQETMSELNNKRGHFTENMYKHAGGDMEELGRGYTGCRTTSLTQVQLLKRLHLPSNEFRLQLFLVQSEQFSGKNALNGCLYCLDEVIYYCENSPLPTPVRVLSRTGSLPDFRKWESCRTMPLVDGFSRGSAVSPALALRRCFIASYSHRFAFIGSQDLLVKSSSISLRAQFTIGRVASRFPGADWRTALQHVAASAGKLLARVNGVPAAPRVTCLGLVAAPTISQAQPILTPGLTDPATSLLCQGMHLVIKASSNTHYALMGGIRVPDASPLQLREKEEPPVEGGRGGEDVALPTAGSARAARALSRRAYWQRASSCDTHARAVLIKKRPTCACQERYNFRYPGSAPCRVPCHQHTSPRSGCIDTCRRKHPDNKYTTFSATDNFSEALIKLYVLPVYLSASFKQSLESYTTAQIQNTESFRIPFGFELPGRTMLILHEAFFATETRKLSFLRQLRFDSQSVKKPRIDNTRVDLLRVWLWLNWQQMQNKQRQKQTKVANIGNFTYIHAQQVGYDEGEGVVNQTTVISKYSTPVMFSRKKRKFEIGDQICMYASWLVPLLLCCARNRNKPVPEAANVDTTVVIRRWWRRLSLNVSRVESLQARECDANTHRCIFSPRLSSRDQLEDFTSGCLTDTPRVASGHKNTADPRSLHDIKSPPPPPLFSLVSLFAFASNGSPARDASAPPPPPPPIFQPGNINLDKRRIPSGRRDATQPSSQNPDVSEVAVRRFSPKGKLAVDRMLQYWMSILPGKHSPHQEEEKIFYGYGSANASFLHYSP
ncbi:hypothetical protein PR048_026467 [Dryococelus australis]|uniref:Uncharacterized protein n=1 Tax=Dryococelus australis TaxID=614101 RepID=A0ABQ9GLE1_9NEOP|nr:hypothetical protein PR048_026467 [Dryococelus australis]